jgi:hypothetical protein
MLSFGASTRSLSLDASTRRAVTDGRCLRPRRAFLGQSTRTRSATCVATALMTQHCLCASRSSSARSESHSAFQCVNVRVCTYVCVRLFVWIYIYIYLCLNEHILNTSLFVLTLSRILVFMCLSCKCSACVLRTLTQCSPTRMETNGAALVVLAKIERSGNIYLLQLADLPGLYQQIRDDCQTYKKQRPFYYQVRPSR